MNYVDQYPAFWRSSPEFCALQAAFQSQGDALAAAALENRDQLCPDTATWGLKYWETALGLPVDEGRDTASRRSRISAKLRGAGVTTVEMIQSVAEAFSGGEVAVLVDCARYWVTIKFVGSFGMPDNMEDLTAALTEIMPAHLRFTFDYILNTWGDTRGYTWGKLRRRTWKEVRERQWQ